jgi:hypothetical protein
MHTDMRPPAPSSMQINHSQAQTLIEVLDGEPILLTQQGDKSLIVAGSLSTIEITTAGSALEA